MCRTNWKLSTFKNTYAENRKEFLCWINILIWLKQLPSPHYQELKQTTTRIVIFFGKTKKFFFFYFCTVHRFVRVSILHWDGDEQWSNIQYTGHCSIYTSCTLKLMQCCLTYVLFHFEICICQFISLLMRRKIWSNKYSETISLLSTIVFCCRRRRLVVIIVWIFL